MDFALLTRDAACHHTLQHLISRNDDSQHTHARVNAKGDTETVPTGAELILVDGLNGDTSEANPLKDFAGVNFDPLGVPGPLLVDKCESSKMRPPIMAGVDAFVAERAAVRSFLVDNGVRDLLPLTPTGETDMAVGSSSVVTPTADSTGTGTGTRRWRYIGHVFLFLLSKVLDRGDM